MTHRVSRASPRRSRLIAIPVLLAGVTVLAPSSAREFGEHERPWAQDALAPTGECHSANQRAAAEQIAGYAPAPRAAFEPAERALARAADLQVRLDAYAAELVAKRQELDAAARDLKAEAERLGALREAVAAESDRLSALEGEAAERRIDVLRNARPKQAAALLIDVEPSEIAQLFAAMTPRDSAAIMAELPQRTAAEVFEHMKPNADAETAREG